MAFLHDVSESLVLVPVLAAFLILALVIAILAILRKQKQQRQSRVDTFLPPFVGGHIPKEQTYVVPRDWKPTLSNKVYAPLSVPIDEVTQQTPRSPNKLMQSIIHVLPPRQGTDFV